MTVLFNYPYITGNEAVYLNEVLASRNLSGSGSFTKRCEQWLEEHSQCQKAFLVTSCTAALEMAAMLIDMQPGDEIIMPSFTFVSTANAFAMHSGIPVFVDIRPDTFNIDETLIEAAITKKTKAIVILHYAGVACEIESILAIAKKHKLYVIEDNAHGLLANYKNKPLGSFGHLATLSFHETKNITCGQGGALLVNDDQLIERAYILRDTGTNRQAFEQRVATQYTWVDKGSNYSLSEIQAAFLWAQLEAVNSITRKRLDSWMRYMGAFAPGTQTKVRLPAIPEQCEHNGHIFPLILPTQALRDDLIAYLANRQISAHFHYVPLHNSPAYKKLCNHPSVALPITEQVSKGLLRLPLWVGIEAHQDKVIKAVSEWITQCR